MTQRAQQAGRQAGTELKKKKNCRQINVQSQNIFFGPYPLLKNCRLQAGNRGGKHTHKDEPKGADRKSVSKLHSLFYRFERASTFMN